MNHDQEAPPVACSLTASELGLRMSRWRALLAQADPRVSRTSRGLRLSLAARPGADLELTELAALERDCCAFATWSVTAEGDRLVLDVSAIAGDGVPAVQALFADL